MKISYCIEVHNEPSIIFQSLKKIDERLKKFIGSHITEYSVFFSTQLAICAKRASLSVSELSVSLKNDTITRISLYKMVEDTYIMLKQLVHEACSFYQVQRLVLPIFFFSFLIFFLSLASFNFKEGLNLYFWRDDWTALWFLKSDLKFYFFQWVLPGRHPGEFLVTFPWYFLFGTNTLLWQLFGVFLKFIASFACGLISFSMFKNWRAAVISTILFATYFGGLEGFTWISARLSGVLIIVYSVAIFIWSKARHDSRFLSVLLPLLLLALLLEPGRSVFLIGIICLNSIMQDFRKIKVLLSLLLTVPLGLMGTAYGQTMLGFKSSELVSPYERSIIERAFVPDSILQYFRSLASLVVGQMFVEQYPQRSLFVSSFIFLLLVIFILYLCYQKRKNSATVFFFLVWIFVFYSAGWISDPGHLTSAASRHFTLSAVGVVVLVSFFVAHLKPPLRYLLLITLILFNLLQSKQAIQMESYMRASQLVVPLLQKQQSDVPLDYERGVFIVSGAHMLRGYVFDWSYGGGLPFALERNISDPLKVPAIVSVDEAKQMYCDGIPVRYYLDNYIEIKTEPLALENIYSWVLDDSGNLKENSAFVREEISRCDQVAVKL